MRVVYIAGPYSASCPYEVEQNIRRAEAIAIEVARLGCAPLCPHTMMRWTPLDLHAFAYRMTLELMRRCDAVLFAEDWQRSMGARDEHAEAVRLGLPVFFALPDLLAWAAS